MYRRTRYIKNACVYVPLSWLCCRIITQIARRRISTPLGNGPDEGGRLSTRLRVGRRNRTVRNEEEKQPPPLCLTTKCHAAQEPTDGAGPINNGN